MSRINNTNCMVDLNLAQKSRDCWPYYIPNLVGLIKIFYFDIFKSTHYFRAILVNVKINLWLFISNHPQIHAIFKYKKFFCWSFKGLMSSNSSIFKVTKNLPFLHPSEIELLNKLCTLGGYYKSLQAFIDSYSVDLSPVDKVLNRKNMRFFCFIFILF